jgi:hypothetical protein
MEAFSPEQRAALSAMIQEAFQSSLSTNLKDILKSTIEEIVKGISPPSAPVPLPRLTTTATTPATSRPQIRPQYRIRQLATTLHPKQQLWLMHSFERILMKSYEMHKYTAYTHFQSIRQPKEMSGVTFRFLLKTTRKTPTDSDINNFTNQRSAIEDHIKTGKALIADQKAAIRQLFSTLDLTNDDITNSIDTARKEAIKNTTHIQLTAHNEIYLYITNASIQLLYTEMRRITPADQQTRVEEYIELMKQIATTKTKMADLDEHAANYTYPAHISSLIFPWSGPSYTNKMDEIWKQANRQCHNTIAIATYEMLKLQLAEQTTLSSATGAQYSNTPINIRNNNTNKTFPPMTPIIVTSLQNSSTTRTANGSSNTKKQTKPHKNRNVSLYRPASTSTNLLTRLKLLSMHTLPPNTITTKK